MRCIFRNLSRPINLWFWISGRNGALLAGGSDWSLEELSKEFSGKVTFGKCNTEENRALAMQFNITAIPSIMLFSNGQLVDRIIGAYPKEALREKIVRKFNLKNKKFGNIINLPRAFSFAAIIKSFNVNPPAGYV